MANNLNSLKFGDKVIKADYSSESDRVRGFFMQIFHAVHPRFENMFHCSEVSIGVTSGIIVCSEF